MNDRILFYLDDYLIHNIKGRVLHRQVCEDFQRWTKPVWSRANKKLRTKLRNMMETHDVFFKAHVHLVPDLLAELVEQGQRPAKRACAKIITSSYIMGVHMYICTYLRVWGKTWEPKREGVHTSQCRYVGIGTRWVVGTQLASDRNPHGLARCQSLRGSGSLMTTEMLYTDMKRHRL